MPFILTFLGAWLAFLVFAKKAQWRLYIPACMLAMIMSLTTDVLMIESRLWSYNDPTDILKSFVLINLWDDFGIYPVTTYLFLRYFPYGQSKPRKFVYFLGWTIYAISLEALYLRSGWMKHQGWWSLPYSYAADWLIYYALYRFHLMVQTQLLDVRVSGGGPLHYQLQAYRTIPLHSHPCDEWLRVVKGRIELEIDGKSRTMCAGEEMLLQAHHMHAARNLDAEPAELISLFAPVQQAPNAPTA